MTEIWASASIKSIIITAYLGFYKWDQIFTDKVIAAAIVDRLTFKAFIIDMVTFSGLLHPYLSLFPSFKPVILSLFLRLVASRFWTDDINSVGVSYEESSPLNGSDRSFCTLYYRNIALSNDFDKNNQPDI